MEPKDYILTRIEGEYAYIRELENVGGEEVFIALALLPPSVDIGTRLHFENLSYSVIE